MHARTLTAEFLGEEHSKQRLHGKQMTSFQSSLTLGVDQYRSRTVMGIVSGFSSQPKLGMDQISG